MAGAAILMPRHRERMAGMTLLVELQQRMRRHVDVYFSMVRRRACWASLVNRSTSVSTTTVTKEAIHVVQCILKQLRSLAVIYRHYQQQQKCIGQQFDIFKSFKIRDLLRKYVHGTKVPFF